MIFVIRMENHLIPAVGPFVCLDVSTAIFIQLFPLQAAPPERI